MEVPQATNPQQSLPHPMIVDSPESPGSSMDDAVEMATKILGGQQETPSDQQDNQPQAEPEEAAPEPEQPDADNAVEEGADAKDSDTPETAVFELPLKGEDGQPLKVTAEELKDWRDNGLRQADYTRKTQEVQRTAQEIAAEREQIRTIAVQTVQQYTQRLDILNKAVQSLANAGFEGVNWDKLANESPEEYNRMFPRYQQQIGKAQAIISALEQEKTQNAAQLKQAEARALAEAEQKAAQSVPEVVATLKRDIPNWSDEYYGQLMNYAIQNDFPAEYVAKSTSPNEFRILHKAYQYDLSQKRAPKVKQIAAAKPLPPASKPGITNPGSVPDKRTELFARARSTGSKDDAASAISAILSRR